MVPKYFNNNLVNLLPLNKSNLVSLQLIIIILIFFYNPTKEIYLELKEKLFNQLKNLKECSIIKQKIMNY